MKRFWQLVLWLLLIVPLHAQVMQQAIIRSPLGAQTPSGTLFTESFGDTGSSPCGYSLNSIGLSSYTGCNVQWGGLTVGTLGSVAIGTSPGTKAYPQGPNSLNIVTGTSATYVQSVGFTPNVPIATTFDAEFSLYIASTSLGAFNAQSLFITSDDSAGLTFPCKIQYHSTSGGQIAISGVGSSTSSDITVSLTTDHIVDEHCASGTNNSYITLDGGAHQTFTANANDWNYVTFGDISGNLQTVSYSIGYFIINSSVLGIGAAQPMYANFETSTNGTSLTNTILTAATFGGNGDWGACAGGTAAELTIATAGQLSLLAPITILGVSYNDSGATRGVGVDLSITSGQTCPYTFATFAPQATVAFKYKSTLPTSDTTTFASGVSIAGGGNDYVGLMENSGNIYIETFTNPNGAPDIGSKFAYTAGTTYFIELQFLEHSGTNYHTMWIYDSSCTLLSTQQKVTAAGGSTPPTGFNIGRGDSGTASFFSYYDNVVADYARGTFIACY